MTIPLTRRALAVVLCAALPLMASAALQEGQPAPEIQLQASLAGQAFGYSLHEALKKGPVVVYFYPSAFTGGCNLQAHTFAVNADKFAAAGASIIGVSLDDIARLNDFSADPQSCAGKIPVASDADGRVSRAYQLTISERQPGRRDTRGKVIEHDRVERTTFIVTPDGKVSAIVGGVAPDENVQKALELVQKGKKGNLPTTPAARPPAIPGVVAADTLVELIQEGFSGTAGPVALVDGSLLFTARTSGYAGRAK